MYRLLLIIAALMIGSATIAQSSFQTIVPAKPVVNGESFTVQYVLKGDIREPEVLLPDFWPCRLISGPDIHVVSNGSYPTRNYVFTLQAPGIGRYRVPGIVIKSEGQRLQSEGGWVQVTERDKHMRLTQQEASSDYYLAPGENAREKIRKNLFVNVSVNTKTCYAGQPVTATFKLYSRLESKSDIVKNPGFYGFTVYDMVSLDDKVVTTEEINGRLFDVHTIRKVQLYPLQPGVFSIDAMHIKNKVEFSRSAVYKKTEQEIIEGLAGGADDKDNDPDVEVVETDIETEPVNITVKPLPEKSKPADFNGAVGRFNIKANVSAGQLAKNEEGFLEVTISGSGNFIQLEAPVINWPSNLEGFEPVIRDSLDKNGVPLQGSRTFRYAFVSGIPGNYKVPAIRLSFFDPGDGAFHSIQSEETALSVSNEAKQVAVPAGQSGTSIASANKKAARTAVVIVVSLVLLILLYWIIKKKDKQPLPEQEKPALPSADELLQPVMDVMDGEGNEFYKALHTAAWDFLRQRFHLSGSEMNKQFAAGKMKLAGVDDELSIRFFAMLSQCEQGLYTGAALEEEKEALVKQAKEIMRKMEEMISLDHSAYL